MILMCFAIPFKLGIRTNALLRGFHCPLVKKPGEKSAKQEDDRQWMSSLIHHAKVIQRVYFHSGL